LSLIGHAKAVLRQILSHVPEMTKSADRPLWLQSLVDSQKRRTDHLTALASDNRDGIHPATLAREIGASLPDDALVVYDGGHTSFWTNDFTPAPQPGERFNDAGMAQLGFGTPFAHGIKIAFPDRPVFNIIGDGSFGFTLPELDTARRYGLNVVHIIHNNESWGVIKAGQRRAGFEFGSELAGTDYAAIARGFGCYGERVTDRNEIKPAIERALRSGKPAVLDVITWFEPHPSMPHFGASLR
jgi:thiamine pyrophosphate-dependent acetolactate synthase large subunit-like protein